MGNNRKNKINKTDKWARVRAELKREFAAMNVTRCEMCGGGFALSFAHSLKRRFIDSDEKLKEVALLCQICHDRVEHSGHEAMYQAITDLITRRRLRTETSDETYMAILEENALDICSVCGYKVFSLDEMQIDTDMCITCWEAIHAG